MAVDFYCWKDVLCGFFEFQKSMSCITSLESNFILKTMRCDNTIEALNKIKSFSNCITFKKKKITQQECIDLLELFKRYSEKKKNKCVPYTNQYHVHCEHKHFFEDKNNTHTKIIDVLTSYEWEITNSLFLQITNTKINKFKKSFYSDMLVIMNNVYIADHLII